MSHTSESLQLVLIRHGESEWNRLNLFTGWTDVDLSEGGARRGGRGRPGPCLRGLRLRHLLHEPAQARHPHP